MKKITLSLTDETESELRKYAQNLYHGMRGGLSLIAEQALREYFEKLKKSRNKVPIKF